MPAAQVEVQAPPGLEEVSACGLPSGSLAGPKDAVTPSNLDDAATAAAAAAAARPKTEKEFKDAIVREVTQAVREHVEFKTATAVDALWQRGQRAMQYLQQQQASQAEMLQGQLAACAQSYQNLERENAILRNSLEALMKHLTLVLGPPAHCMPPAPCSPFFPARAAQAHHAAAAAAAAAAAVPPAAQVLPAAAGGLLGPAAADMTPRRADLGEVGAERAPAEAAELEFQSGPGPATPQPELPRSSMGSSAPTEASGGVARGPPSPRRRRRCGRRARRSWPRTAPPEPCRHRPSP